jgi:hypothetical protein
VLLLRLSPMTLVIDEFSYYAYHKSNYDRNFKFLADLCWRFNNEKWVPSPLEPAINSISKEALDNLEIADWAARRPRAHFKRLNESVYFLNNAQEFLLLNLPLSTTTFTLGWLLTKKLTCWKLPVNPEAVFNVQLPHRDDAWGQRAVPCLSVPSNSCVFLCPRASWICSVLSCRYS